MPINKRDFLYMMATLKLITLESEFDEWDLVIAPSNTTVAHICAEYLKFPKDFKYWNLKNDKGITVAHISLVHGNLPAGETVESLISNLNKETKSEKELNEIFERAADGTLDSDFTDWDLRNDKGDTVAHVYVQDFYLEEDEFPNFDSWDLKNAQDLTVAHLYISKRPMPKNFNQWGLTTVINGKVITVAEFGYTFGNLPEGETIGGLLNKSKI